MATGERDDNETFTIVAATPPDNYPHDTAQNEVARLGEWLTVEHTYSAGTQRIVTDPTELGNENNELLVQVERNTLNAITAIKSFVSGAWARWKIGTDDIDPDALGVMLDIESSKLTVELDETLPLRAAVDGKQEIFAKPLVNGTNLAYTADDEPIMEVPTEAVIDFPTITNQLCFNKGETNEIRMGSNTGAVSPDYPEGYAHGWIGSWKGAPIDVYITKDGFTSLFTFSEDGLAVSLNGAQYALGIDPDYGCPQFTLKKDTHSVNTVCDTTGNVLVNTTGGGTQNFQWTSDLGKSWFWGGSTGQLQVDALHLKKISFDTDPSLVLGDVYADHTTGVLAVKL